MKHSKKSSLLTLLLGAVIALSSHAQDNVESFNPEVLDLSSLDTGWWSHFSQPGEDSTVRADRFITNVSLRIAGMQASNRPVAEGVLEVIRDNFNAYHELLADSEAEPKELPLPAESYTIADLLEVAAISREARAIEVQEQLDVERERRILDGTSQRRDLAFKRYVAAPAGDERLLAALRLVQTRTTQAIAAKRHQLLTENHQRATAHAEATVARVELARERLPTTFDEARLAELAADVDEALDAASKAQERLHAAEIAASRLAPDTADGRSLLRLERQKLIEAQVVATLAELTSLQSRLLLSLANLLMGTAPDFDGLEERSLATMEFVRGAQESVPDWQRESESELLAVQTANRDGLSRASRRLLDQRLGTVQGTLNRIGELQAAAADMELLIVVIEQAFAENVGQLRSWLTISKRELIRFYNRVTGLADVTLFSVGEAPVTGLDVLRVLIIMIVAFLLSRGIRFAIGRVGRNESPETQASLYTVGRLTHYAIIIIALIIALSSIGLDFSSLALIAGALSVGIGFGLQSIVSNFFSGLIILFEHSLRVGDYIELDTGLTGTVKSINVRSTLINTNDNIDIVVPNSEFVTARLTNWTLGERILRVRIPFGVAYGSDKELVKKAAQEAAAKVPYTLTHMKGREPDVWLVNFGDSSLDFLLLVWVNRQGARRPTRTRAAYLWELDSKLREYGIEIPFPQRDLNLRTGWPGSQQEPEGLPEPEDDQQDMSD